MKNKLKIGLSVLLALLAVAGSVGLWAWQNHSHLRLTEGKLQLHFIDVGQGDAALLVLPTGERIMIDTGTEESGEAILAHLAKWDVKALDLVILSHNHDDHAGGLAVLSDAIAIGGVLYAGEAPKNCNLDLREVQAGDAFTIGDVHFAVLGPLTDEESENRSMILRVDYGERSFLFTGDAEEEEEVMLVEQMSDYLNVDLLKVAHHGSAYSSAELFLQAVSPDIAVISASADNNFGHPAPTTVEKLKSMGAMVYRTDRQGTLVFLCDGYTLTRYRSAWKI